MSKKKIGILLFLGIVIIILVVLNMISFNKKNEDQILTLDLWKEHYQEEMKQVDSNMLLDEKNKEKESDKKLVYRFDNSCYLVVSYDSKKLVEKVYFHVLKENYNNQEFQKRLRVLVKSMKMDLSNNEVNKIVSKLQDIENKKADDLGLLVQFEQENYEYITMEKKEALEFFIYSEKED